MTRINSHQLAFLCGALNPEARLDYCPQLGGILCELLVVPTPVNDDDLERASVDAAFGARGRVNHTLSHGALDGSPRGG